ncbi:protein Mis18-beta [Athene cunicularia]|uniref:protein Mis18-beta n=1 Tax=Athene cunicularia TaxID=194338 RepID=UPI000EF655BE|nr:protein Mis18-beta [Athene cunicularia]
MAVRRQLRGFFQESQFSGFVTVERPLSRAGSLCYSQFSSSPSPPPPPAKVAALLPRQWEPPVEDCAVFHCRDCWAVLGDSLHLCAQKEQCGIGFLVCFKVTNDVTWEDSLVMGLEGALLGCAYNKLCCRVCGLIVGFILYSASRDLAYLRGFFCFFQDSILCYVLKKQIIVEASKVNFPAVTLKEQVQKLKEKLVEIHIRIELLIKQLQELKQNNNVSERQWQRSASDALGQHMQ